MNKGWLTIVITSRLLLLPPVLPLKETDNREALIRIAGVPLPFK